MYIYMIYECFHIAFFIPVSMGLSLCGDDRSSELLCTALATNPESKSNPNIVLATNRESKSNPNIVLATNRESQSNPNIVNTAIYSC